MALMYPDSCAVSALYPAFGSLTKQASRYKRPIPQSWYEQSKTAVEVCPYLHLAEGCSSSNQRLIKYNRSKVALSFAG